jgi:hypothetical protein
VYRHTIYSPPNRQQEAWGRSRAALPASDEVEKLKTLGYLAGYERAPNDKGVVVYHRQLAYHGYNYYATADAPEVILMDMNGHVMHRWNYDFRNWPDQERPEGESGYFRRAYVFDTGDLLAIYDPRNRPEVGRHILLKLDKNSNLLWSFPHGAHHDFQVMDDGRIYVLTREFRKHARVREGNLVVEDFVTILNPHGELIKRVSILDAFANSMFSSVVEGRSAIVDILHTNTLEVLDGRLEARSPAFRAGNVLISACHTGTVAVIDIEQEKVVWALSGMWERQHQPTVLKNGNMLVFDNEGHHGFSKVIELNPFTQQVLWSYEGTQANGFFSSFLGSALRLPNRNTLITESTAGRSFELTPEKKIVWEFRNPRRAGKDEELIAVICEMIRLDPDFNLDWLQ